MTSQAPQGPEDSEQARPLRVRIPPGSNEAWDDPERHGATEPQRIRAGRLHDELGLPETLVDRFVSRHAEDGEDTESLLREAARDIGPWPALAMCAAHPVGDLIQWQAVVEEADADDIPFASPDRFIEVLHCLRERWASDREAYVRDGESPRDDVSRGFTLDELLIPVIPSLDVATGAALGESTTDCEALAGARKELLACKRAFALDLTTGIHARDPKLIRQALFDAVRLLSTPSVQLLRDLERQGLAKGGLGDLAQVALEAELAVRHKWHWKLHEALVGEGWEARASIFHLFMDDRWRGIAKVLGDAARSAESYHSQWRDHAVRILNHVARRTGLPVVLRAPSYLGVRDSKTLERFVGVPGAGSWADLTVRCDHNGNLELAREGATWTVRPKDVGIRLVSPQGRWASLMAFLRLAAQSAADGRAPCWSPRRDARGIPDNPKAAVSRWRKILRKAYPSGVGDPIPWDRSSMSYRPRFKIAP